MFTAQHRLENVFRSCGTLSFTLFHYFRSNMQFMFSPCFGWVIKCWTRYVNKIVTRLHVECWGRLRALKFVYAFRENKQISSLNSKGLKLMFDSVCVYAFFAISIRVFCYQTIYLRAEVCCIVYWAFGVTQSFVYSVKPNDGSQWITKYNKFYIEVKFHLPEL